ncbi:MAG: hypothetical protein KC516_04360 [Nanoarchaeota archaeon]|nr:hypothetical protein [Nanoarchaeota archaeon]
MNKNLKSLGGDLIVILSFLAVIFVMNYLSNSEEETVKENPHVSIHETNLATEVLMVNFQERMEGHSYDSDLYLSLFSEIESSKDSISKHFMSLLDSIDDCYALKRVILVLPTSRSRTIQKIDNRIEELTKQEYYD